MAFDARIRSKATTNTVLYYSIYISILKANLQILFKDAYTSTPTQVTWKLGGC